MAVKYKPQKQSQQKLESLLALGMYQAEAQALKDYLRQIQAEYSGPVDLQHLRKRLAQKLGKKSLSDMVKKMREEEMH